MAPGLVSADAPPCPIHIATMSAPLATMRATMSEARTGQRRGSGTRMARAAAGREAVCTEAVPGCGGDPTGRSLDAIVRDRPETPLKRTYPRGPAATLTGAAGWRPARRRP